jgi:ABC-type sugar transport system ATPase subunit
MESMPVSEKPLLVLHDISKSFGGVQALSNVSLTVKRGEVHAIVGENGAGKSTMMKIIAGALHSTSGTVEFNGSNVEFKRPGDASEAGIAIVYQEPMFFKELSVLENIYLGKEIRTAIGSMDWEKMTEGAEAALEKIGLPSHILNKPMSELSLGTQQLVLIARSIHRNANLLILDEPNAILSQAETEILFRSIKELKERGVSILYISHRIEEIFQIADRISVLRDGKLVAGFAIEEATEENLISAMTGRKISYETYRPRDLNHKGPVLEVRGLSRVGYYTNVSFEILPGEVLGLYGLVGAGRSEVAQAIYGEMPPDEGVILYKGRQIAPHSSREAIRLGITYVPEDRRYQGLFLIRSVRDNLTAGLLPSLSNFLGIIKSKAEMAMAKAERKRINIKTSNLLAPVSSLSGGNQQKVVLGRGLSHEPQVILFDEPTHGIDVGTKSEIHNLIMSLAEQGIAILLISSELPEVLALSDNVLVMHEGLITGYVPRNEATEATILRLALGLSESSLKSKSQIFEENV